MKKTVLKVNYMCKRLCDFISSTNLRATINSESKRTFLKIFQERFLGREHTIDKMSADRWVVYRKQWLHSAKKANLQL